jgi:V8-like Glu-specific endopeptidase
MAGAGVVGLLIPVGERGMELCSGAVIAPNVVLSARHCLGADPDLTPHSERERSHPGGC